MTTHTRSTLYKTGLVALAVVLLIASSATQRRMNAARDKLGFTRVPPLKNAPPVLVFTTVVLGGFRGLIANALWIRAMDLQDQDKYFEMVQLADWITKLQPHMASVWIVQAWNMSYNISIKFSDPPERWLWVLRGIELLRDQALKYNPHEVTLYRELAWHFQHKIGHYLDDAHLFYKNVWAEEMQAVLGSGHPDWEQLVKPQTDDARARVKTLREKYKLDPAVMKSVDEQYGPLEWRLPEAHALYWAALGKQMAKTKKDLIQLRRVIYQSMQLAFRRGRLIENKFDERYEFTENVDIVDKTNAAYEEAMAEDDEMRNHISIAHRNFLLDAAYFLYVHARYTDAQRYLDLVRQKYPAFAPSDGTVDAYALRRLGEDIEETDRDRTISNIRGVLIQSYYNLALGEDDRANGLARLALTIWNNYQGKVSTGGSEKRVGLPSMDELKASALDRLLDPQEGVMNPQLQNQLRTRLRLPVPETIVTNAPPSV